MDSDGDLGITVAIKNSMSDYSITPACLAVVYISSNINANMVGWNGMHSSKKRVSIRKKMEMWVKSIAIFALTWYHDNKTSGGNAAEFGNSLTIVQDVFKHMCANDCVEVRIWKRQLLYPA